MPLYGRMSLANLPVDVAPADGWACKLEIDREAFGPHNVVELPMSETDVRELIDMLEESLR